MRGKGWFLALFVGALVGYFAHGEVGRSKDEVKPPMDGVQYESPLPRNLFVELAKRVNPAVVNISTSVALPGYGATGQGRDPFQDMIEEFFGQRGLRPRKQQQQIPQAQALGTGFIIREDGYILTNNHVTQEGAIKVSLASDPNTLFDATVVGRDVRGDLSLIKINPGKKLPFLQFGSSEKIQVGEWVAAFGNPFGHANTLTVGVLSAKGRYIDEINRWPFLQTDASINQGNSGGPLVDTNGYVVGVNTAIDARAQGIGFAIPVDYIKEILPTLYKGDTVRRGFLGMGVGAMNSMIAQNLNVSEDFGAIITEVMPGGPATKSGLRPYDIILEFNGKKVEDESALIRMVQDAPVGSKVNLKIIRPLERGKVERKTLTATIGAHPQDGSEALAEAPSESPRQKSTVDAPFNLGFTLSDDNRRLKDRTQLEGPVVVSVKSQSVAALSGLAPGDVIVDINKTKVTSAAQAIKLLQKGSNIIRIARGQALAVIALKTP